MTGRKTRKEVDNEDRHGRKRFIERQIQDNLAKKEIEEYDDYCLDDSIDRDAINDRLRELRKY
jgi:hypothetical protein